MYQPDSLNLEALDPLLDRTALDGRTQLIPVLLQAQQLYGHLPEAVMARISERLHVPLAEIQSVTDFYSMLYDQPMGDDDHPRLHKPALPAGRRGGRVACVVRLSPDQTWRNHS